VLKLKLCVCIMTDSPLSGVIRFAQRDSQPFDKFFVSVGEVNDDSNESGDTGR